MASNRRVRPKPGTSNIPLNDDALCSAIRGHHAHQNTKLHAVHAYVILKYRKSEIARMLEKSRATIASWIDQFRKTGLVTRKSCTVAFKKYDSKKREWVIGYYDENPTAYLHETKVAFEKEWNIAISVSSIWTIITENGYTWKVSFDGLLIVFKLKRLTDQTLRSLSDDQ
jgi:transposase